MKVTMVCALKERWRIIRFQGEGQIQGTDE